MAGDYSNNTRAELIRLLQARDAEPRLGLFWEKDLIEREKALNDDFVALDLLPELCEGAAPWQNALIEGDNLDALRNLAAPLAGKVKCIYIDPPYNTGTNDFIYNDRYMDAKHRYRHSTWLEYMHRRLTAAKPLLAGDGVIFVSIGDDEQARLSLLMEQIFGAAAKVGVFTWRRRSGANDEKTWFVSTDHEYVLCFANAGFSFRGLDKDFSGYTNPDNDKRGDWKDGDLTKAANLKMRPNTFYPLHNTKTDVWYPCNPDRVWSFACEKRANGKTRRQTMEQLIREGRVIWPKEKNPALYRNENELKEAIESGEAPRNLRLYLVLDEIFASIERGEAPEGLREYIPPLSFWVGKKIGRGSPKYKRFLSEVKNLQKPVSTWFVPSSIKRKEMELLDASEARLMTCGYTQEGTKLVSTMVNNRDFSFPKPLSLVKALVNSATEPDAGHLVLDFFAGSGTTGHAVMELNDEDGGDRRFVLVSSTEATAKEPQKNVCRDIGAKRLAAAVNGYEYTANGTMQKVGGLDGDFAYFRTARIVRGSIRDKIGHAQVWTALQMIHFPNTVPLPKGRKWAAHESEQEQIIYLTDTAPATLKQASDKAAHKNRCTVYSWQPAAAVAAFDGEVQVERIPEFILRRYGLDKE